jgi:hypothetical protein
MLTARMIEATPHVLMTEDVSIDPNQGRRQRVSTLMGNTLYIWLSAIWLAILAVLCF